MSCVDVRLSLTCVDYYNLLISGGERGDQLWLPKDGWDLPSQDRTKRQVRIVTFILNCTEILLYPRFGHLGVAINLITYDDRFALHRWVFSAPNVRSILFTRFQWYNFFCSNLLRSRIEQELGTEIRPIPRVSNSDCCLFIWWHQKAIEVSSFVDSFWQYQPEAFYWHFISKTDVAAEVVLITFIICDPRRILTKPSTWPSSTKKKTRRSVKHKARLKRLTSRPFAPQSRRKNNLF